MSSNAPEPSPASRSNQIPLQRKTTLKWSTDGELSAIDMARILNQLTNAELTECDLTCDMNEKK